MMRCKGDGEDEDGTETDIEVGNGERKDALTKRRGMQKEQQEEKLNKLKERDRNRRRCEKNNIQKGRRVEWEN